MESSIKEKEVSFGHYCSTCKYCKTAEDEDPCHECLNVPSRYGTQKPINYEKK